MLGSQVSQFAIPWLAAVVLHVSPLEFSVLGIVELLPFVVFALPAGVWVDRLPRRQILILADAGRAVLLATIPVTYAFDMLSYWQLLTTAFLVGTCAVFFDVAYLSYIPSLVSRDDLVRANSRLELSFSVAQVAGPGMAGALISALTAPYAIVLDAISYVISLGFVIGIRYREGVPARAPAASKPKMIHEARDGLRFLLGHAWLRAIAISTAIANFFISLTWAVLLLFLTRTLQLSSFDVGFIFALGSCGSILAALLTGRVQHRMGVGGALVLPALLISAQLAYPLAPSSFPIPVLIVGLLFANFGIVAFNITQRSLRQAVTPARLLGRTNAAMRWIVWSTMPIGSLCGGGIATVFGVRTALWVGGAGATVAVVPLLRSSVRALGAMPSSDTPRPALQPNEERQARGAMGHGGTRKEELDEERAGAD